LEKIIPDITPSSHTIIGRLAITAIDSSSPSILNPFTAAMFK